MMNKSSFFVGALVLSALARPILAQDSRWNSNEQGGFIVSLNRDSRGEIWAGTEDHGVSHFSGGKWKTFGVKDGLGDDDAYALASDRLGREWVGHLNHGVSVWNGRAWKNYGVNEGPLGERVFALATSPFDGDVWIAHNAGLTRYSLQNDSWTHYNRANGFPTDEISALTFDSLGRLYVGTQHDGVLKGSPDDHFKSWRAIKGAATMPTSPAGAGLPSNRINDLLVTDDDTLYAATDTGLATSQDFGESWTFVRGRDWKEKVEGKKLTPVEVAGSDSQLLAEDYVTSLTEDDRALLWIGYRRHGYEVRRPLVNKASFYSPADKGENFPYASAMLPLGDGSVLLGYYNQGVKISDKVPAFTPTAAEQKWAQVQRGWKLQINAQLPVAPLPKPAGAPSADELKQLLTLVRNRTKTPVATSVVQLPDDWTTQGTWLGRYGRYWACLSAMVSPYDYIWGAGNGVEYAAQIGPDAPPDDALRYWIHWLYTADERSLEIPNIFLESRVAKGYVNWSDDPTKQEYRRQSEWDDHGEAYPLTKDGLGIYVTLKIPRGDYVLSLFDRNKDGHDGFNRARDYMISVRPHPHDADENAVLGYADFENQPELASSRLRDFWGSDWKRFAVRGPQELTVRLDRNYSFNTILAGVFLDEIKEEPTPYFDAQSDAATKWHADKDFTQPQDAVAEALWAELQKAKADDVLWWSANGRLFYQALLRLYQPALTRTTAPQLPALWRRIGTCNYVLCQYPAWEAMQEKRGLTTARTTELNLQWDKKSDYSGRGRETVIAQKEQNVPTKVAALKP